MLSEGVFRVTCLADYASWADKEEGEYQVAKGEWFATVQRSARSFLAPVDDEALVAATLTTDMFTPRTITKFTGHLGGAIYGSPGKNRQGRTALANLYLCGTDQGFLGIVGAMLSGISMANYHILQRG
jgi:phytoene dehydrogenase-like protein